MNVLIVEDETAAFNNLKKILRDIDSSITVTANTESVSQTVEWLQLNPGPDLIFMDIHLSDGLAFNIFNLLTIDTPVIFTTAYDEYAIEAFRVNSLDYLLKPIEPENVKRALDKFKKFSHSDVIRYLSKLTKIIPDETKTDTILVPVNDKLAIVKIPEISCFYNCNEKTRILMKDGTAYFYGRSLDSIYQRLDSIRFFRANKQFIIAKDTIQNITIWFDNRLLISLDITTPERIYISKNRASEFKKWMVKG